MPYIAPSVFLGHGTPMLALADEDPFTASLRLLAKRHPAPRAVVVASAHGFQAGPAVLVDGAGAHHSQHDYAGFPPELHAQEYRTPGHPDFAAQTVTLLQRAVGTSGAELAASGVLDHGTWMPLRWMYPDGVPVVPVRLATGCTPRDALALGQALSPLRERGVMILGSGGAVHNLAQLVWHHKVTGALPYAVAFEQWVVDHLRQGHVEALARYMETGPLPDLAHPTPEHFLPLLMALGAALPQDVLDVFFQGIQYASLSMLSFTLSSPTAEILSVHG